MASLFGHSVAGLAIGKASSAQRQPLTFWLLSVYCTVLPDGDVLSFFFGIQYGDMFGHRGFFHSIIFTGIVGLVVTLLFFKQTLKFSALWWRTVGYFSLVTFSHPFLDAFTNGGLGVAFFSPFDTTRYFFPWRPLEVSPIGGLTHFFGKEGWVVIQSEFIWIWLPSVALILLSYALRHIKRMEKQQ